MHKSILSCSHCQHCFSGSICQPRMHGQRVTQASDLEMLGCQELMMQHQHGGAGCLAMQARELTELRGKLLAVTPRAEPASPSATQQGPGNGALQEQLSLQQREIASLARLSM